MLTVLIATRNGGKTLPGVLEAYGRVQRPVGGFKLVVVVDKGSTDGTPALAERFRDKRPLTWLSENAPGKNAALNRGLTAVAGDLVVLTDDDAVPRSELLVRRRSVADVHAVFSIFGGAVVLPWGAPLPERLLRRLPPGRVFSLTLLALGP